jgi:geranylgeranyl pyrophosphate synthase
LPEGALQRVAGKIELIWAASRAWPDYVEAMRGALPARSQKGDQPGINRLNWVLMPNICCEAAGGDPEWADEISLAWLLFNIAAHVFDSIEDQDKPDSWWRDMGPAAGLNAASGLFFTASLALNRLYQYPDRCEAAHEVNQRFFTQLMQMSAAQHRDLTLAQLTLQEYWEIAAGKSGSFFSLASWAGGRLACNNEERLLGFDRFGHHFGILVQLLDDLQDFREIEDFGERSIEPKAILRSFASAYALDVFSGQERERLVNLLGQLASNPEAEIKADCEALEMIERSGAALYLAIEVERHRGLALRALDRAQPAVPARDQLIALLPDLQSI